MKLIILFLSLSVLLLVGCSSQNENNIISYVGDYKITTDDFIERYSNYLFSTGVSDNIVNRRSILSNMIDEILMQHYDNNDNVYANEEFQKNLVWRKKQSILGLLKDREIYAKISASDSELRTAFQRVNEKISARHLYASTEEEARQLYELLKTGVSFETLAQQVFADSTLKNNGGYLGYFTWGDMDPAFEDAAYSMRVGEISEPVQTSSGYSVIQVVDRMPHPLLTEYEYQNKKSRLEHALRIRKKNPAEIEFIKNAVNFEAIAFNQENLEKLFALIDPAKITDIEEIRANLSDDPCSEYREKEFSVSYLFDRFEKLPYFHREKVNSIKNLTAVIKGFYLQDELLKMAEELGYSDNTEALKMFEKMKKSLFIQYKIDDITKNSTIPDSLVYEFYSTNTDFFIVPPQINLQEIILDNSAKADSVYSLVKSGRDFGELARKFSLRRISAENNGVLGLADVVKFGSMKDYFLNAPINTLLGPKEISGYYGIFKVLEVTESKHLPFDEVENEVRAATKFKYSKKLVKDYLTDLAQNTIVTTNDTLLSIIKIDF